VPVVVRNNTSRPVRGLEVTGHAHDGGGGHRWTGDSQGFQPVVVAPGEVAFGYVYLDTELPPGASFDFLAAEGNTDTTDGEASLAVVDAGLVGDATSRLVGRVANTGETDLAGPFVVDVYCFDGDALVGFAGTFASAAGNRLSAGATAPFTVDVPAGGSRTYMAGASAFGRA